MKISGFLFVNFLFASLVLSHPAQITFNSLDSDLDYNELNPIFDQINFDFIKKGKMKCFTCTKLFDGLRKVIKPTTPLDTIINLGTKTCVTLKIQPENICRHTISLFSPWLVQVLTHKQFDSTHACGALGYCTFQTSPWQPNFPEKPSKPPSRALNETGVKNRYFVQLSDWHYDPEYREGFEADCADPICCRVPHHPKIGMVKRPAGKFGDYHCDSPRILIETVLEKVKSTVPDSEAIIMTGDLPPHDIWQETMNSVITIEQSVADDLKHNFNVPIYMTIGNHENYITNSFPSLDLNLTWTNASWLYQSLAKQWAPWLPPPAKVSMSKYGYYKLYHESKEGQRNLKIISLNTNHAYLLNFWIFLSQTDPDNILNWLVEELTDSESKDEDVWIVGHIPSGGVDVSRFWAESFSSVVTRFNETIKAMFFGHSHRDEFELFYEDPLERQFPVAVGYLGPSITPFTNLNPGFRVYQVDEYNRIKNHFTYILDLPESNQALEPVWHLEYDALSAYQMDTAGWLSPQKWHDLTIRMENQLYDPSPDNDLLMKYIQFEYKSSPKANLDCNLKCRKKRICKLRSSIHGLKCSFHNGFIEELVEPISETVLC